MHPREIALTKDTANDNNCPVMEINRQWSAANNFIKTLWSILYNTSGKAPQIAGKITLESPDKCLKQCGRLSEDEDEGQRDMK